jgi:hypothetical protein
VRATLLTHHTALVHKLEAADKEMPMADVFPTDGMELTHILVVEDIDRSRAFYRDALGAEVYREYGGSSVVLRFLESWLLIVTGGGPTVDKPGVVFAPSGGSEHRQSLDDDPSARLPQLL